MKGPQLVTSPVRLLHPCHVGVTGSHEGSPGGDNVLGALSPGKDQKAAWSTAHVMYQLLKCLLKHGRETGTQQRLSCLIPPAALPPASMPVEGARERWR